MKEKLVSFESAKLLKEKGFNEETIVGYTFEGHLEAPYYGRYFRNSDGENSLAYSAPTQSLAQKWLREKHEIYLAVLSNNENAHRYVFGEGINSKRYAAWYKTYEEALEEGLKEGLMLI